MLAEGAEARRAAAAEAENRGRAMVAAAERDEARIAEIVKEVARFDAAIDEARDRLVTLARQEADAADALHERRARHGASFAAMVALSKARGPALVAHGGEPERAARAAFALEGLREALRAEAADARHRVTEIRDMRARSEAAREEAKVAIASLRQRERELWASAAKRRDGARGRMMEAASYREEAQRLEVQAAALDEAIRRAPIALAPAAAPSPPAKPARAAAQVASLGASPVLPVQPPVAEARGAMVPPVTGTLAATVDGGRGNAARGLVFEAKPYSRVFAPWSGTVSFAGTVRGFGLVTVIDIGEGHHLLLAGLASSEREKGEAVMRGEPIGYLGGPMTGDDAFLAEQSDLPEDAVSSLFMQVRRDGEPIDPKPWLE